MILPCDNNVLRAEVSQRQPYEVLEFQTLSFDIEKLLAKLIHKELVFARQLEIQKHKLTMVPGYDL